jgi:acyl dehydratase
MVNPTALGAQGAPFVLDVERGKIAEFARAVRSAHPAHLRAEGAVIPPTFLTTQFFWEERVEGANPWARVEMSQERGMHAEQEYVFHGPPPRAGERLFARSCITEIWEKTSRAVGALTFVKMVTEHRDAAGALRAESILTGVEKAEATAGPTPSLVTQRPGLSGPSTPSPGPATFAEVIAGQEPPPLVIGPVTRTDFVRYQGASGDLNPVHHDEPFARASGYPAPLGIGMFTAGCMTTWATDWLGPERVRRTRVRWKRPVFPGMTLVCHGAVAARDVASRRVELTLTVVDGDGAALVEGSMVFDCGDLP